MKKSNVYLYILWVIMLIFLPCSISAQNFRGKVIDHQNKPVPFAAIYVRELMRGFTADENGNFHAPLEIGEYSCEISSMGYKPKILNIQITNQTHHRSEERRVGKEC